MFKADSTFATQIRVKLRSSFDLGSQADGNNVALPEDMIDEMCQKSPQGINCWVLPDLR